MAVQVTLGIWNKTQLQKIQIENIDLQAKVKQIRGEALKCLNNSSANIDLSFCGIILNDENTLSSYGITSGTTIHVLEKPNYEKVPCEKKLKVFELVSAFRSLIVCSGYRSALQMNPNIIALGVATENMEDNAPRQIINCIDAFHMSDSNFKKNFRLTKAVSHELIEMVTTPLHLPNPCL